MNNVAWDEIFARDFREPFGLARVSVSGPAPALYARGISNHGAKLRGRLVRTVLLNERGSDRKYDHDPDDNCGANISEQVGDESEA